MIADKGCWERGCMAYDWRDGDGVEVVKREWVGLTDADIKEGADLSRLYRDQFEPVARWAESILKEKNT
jgi:hypothetical protein